jgi:hypothetical protein
MPSFATRGHVGAQFKLSLILVIPICFYLIPVTIHWSCSPTRPSRHRFPCIYRPCMHLKAGHQPPLSHHFKTSHVCWSKSTCLPTQLSPIQNTRNIWPGSVNWDQVSKKDASIKPRSLPVHVARNHGWFGRGWQWTMCKDSWSSY